MGEEVGENKNKKMKILCLHGFRTSGSFLQKQINKWHPSIFANFDLVFPNGKFLAGGKSDIESIFPPPYYEWFQFEKEFTEYTNLEECLDYLCEYITTNGPFDGLLGFSQVHLFLRIIAFYIIQFTWKSRFSCKALGFSTPNASAFVIGHGEEKLIFQEHVMKYNCICICVSQGKLLKDHPPMKLVISISGSRFRKPCIAEVAYKEPIRVKSVHFIGEKDWLKLPSEDLATCFENPLIIRHPQGHTVPRLDEAAIETLSNWTTDIFQNSSTAEIIPKTSNEDLEVTKLQKLEPEEVTSENFEKDVELKNNAEIVQEA
ncbi:hypothetical protein GIB67_024740 [Kingdonia uniflora]|uniref:Serine hydrolase domain-containing protein n=1 Tax=Kingdonia uniflora TaxID=39325 RepID=A0A7J7N9N1_9MAGN|nr:hypothetical protein GIB67_024740 [Kingdonia uniflora]